MSDTAPTVRDTNGHVRSSVDDVVLRFLELLQVGEFDAAESLLAPDVRWINVSLPAIRGRDKVMKALRSAFGLPGAGFEVYFHTVASSGDRVLTERTDVLHLGPLKIQVWVFGRFDVVDGRIALWKDYFDWGNFAVASVRALLGVVVPALRPAPPSEV